MARTFVPLRRIAALSIAIALFAAPIASAQTLEAAAPTAPPANTVLLNDAALARLVQTPRANMAPAPDVADSARPGLLRQGTAAVAREARATAAQAPRQKNWVSRHVGLTWAIILGAVLGPFIIYGVMQSYE